MEINNGKIVTIQSPLVLPSEMFLSLLKPRETTEIIGDICSNQYPRLNSYVKLNKYAIIVVN